MIKLQSETEEAVNCCCLVFVASGPAMPFLRPWPLLRQLLRRLVTIPHGYIGRPWMDSLVCLKIYYLEGRKESHVD